MNNTTTLTYLGETFNQQEVREMSIRITSSVNSEIAKQLQIVHFPAITKSLEINSAAKK